MRDACLTSSELLYAIGDYAWSVSYCTLCSASLATQASMGDCWPWGGAWEELLGATPFSAAGSRPNRGCGPQAAAETARYNVTKPHRPLTYRDAGREWASGAASQSTCQAGASTSWCHWSRSQKGRGPHVDRRSKYNLGGPITPTSDTAELTVSPLIVTAGHRYGSSSSNCYQSSRGCSGLCVTRFEYCS